MYYILIGLLKDVIVGDNVLELSVNRIDNTLKTRVAGGFIGEHLYHTVDGKWKKRSG